MAHSSSNLSRYPDTWYTPACHWGDQTKDAPKDVLAPGYFPTDHGRFEPNPGDRLTIVCRRSSYPDKHGYRAAPLMTVDGVLHLTEDGVWLFLMTHTPVWPATATANGVQALLDVILRGQPEEVRDAA